MVYPFYKEWATPKKQIDMLFNLPLNVAPPPKSFANSLTIPTNHGVNFPWLYPDWTETSHCLW